MRPARPEGGQLTLYLKFYFTISVISSGIFCGSLLNKKILKICNLLIILVLHHYYYHNLRALILKIKSQKQDLHTLVIHLILFTLQAIPGSPC